MKIGVLVATYNGMKYIKEQIDSILHQKCKVDEIIISDDNSTDGTYEFLCDYLAKIQDIDVKIFRNTKKGISNNFFNAYVHSTSDYLFFSDQDDVWFENKTEIFIKAIKKMPDCGMYFSNALVVDAELNSLNCTNFDRFVQGVFVEKKDDIVSISDDKAIKRLFLNNFITGMSMMVKRDVLDKGFITESDFLHNDMLTMYSALNSSICCINTITALYRQHSNNVIGAKSVENKKNDDVTSKNNPNKYVMFALENCYSINYVLGRIKTMKEINHNSKNTDLLKEIYELCMFRESLLSTNSFLGIFKVLFHIPEYLHFLNWKYIMVDIATLLLVRKNNRKNPLG